MIITHTTNTRSGPFVVIVRDSKQVDHEFPMVICPRGDGFKTREEATEWCHSWAGHEDTVDLQAEIRPMRGPSFFKVFMSM